jgi:thioredoxin reductase (NADPH)
VVGRRRNEYDVLIVGGGLAGLTAAWYAPRYGLSAALLEGGVFGGQVATVTTIEGYPSAAKVSGADLAVTLLDGVRGGGVDVVEESARAIQIVGRQFRITSTTQNLRSRAIVFATGARLRELDLPRALDLVGCGVSHCASCDGPLFRGQDVVVVGGGDSALQEAALLSPHCRSVNIVVRGRLRARREFIKRVQSCHNVKFIWNCTIDAILGKDAVTGVRLRDQNNGTLSEIACSGFFPYIGTVPNADLLAGVSKRDDDGRLLADSLFATSHAGIYAVGAVRSGFSGELCSAAGEGAAAIKTIAASFD